RQISLARQISKNLDHFPLAIEYAGAYIVENECSLSDYLNLYDTRRIELFRTRPKYTSPEFHKAIATIWSVSFEKIEKINPEAGELLQLCAFLSSAPIPQEIITDAPKLSNALKPIATNPMILNAAIQALLNFSFIHRDAEAK